MAVAVPGLGAGSGMSLLSCQGILSSTSAAIRVTFVTRARLLAAGHVQREPNRALWARRDGDNLGEKTLSEIRTNPNRDHRTTGKDL